MDQDKKTALLDKLELDTITNDSSCIAEIARFILDAHPHAEAKLVLELITVKKFPVQGDLHDPQLDKKYLLFYVAHELIFKSLDRGSAEGEDRFAWVRAIGDNLTQWVASLVLFQGEKDFFRL